MRIRILLFLMLFSFCTLKAVIVPLKNSLNDELVFAGDHIVYKGKKITLGPKAFYVDAQLTGIDAQKYPYVFTSVNEAVKHLTNGTENEPMTLYIAPWVYWIDNPDDPTVREPATIGGTPFGLEIDCEWLRFYGLTDDARNVVLASNRGQTMGAKGNFTMFRITGNGTSAENITFGNYCNIDLEYPLNTALNRAKRGSAIVQAQLAFCFGDKIMARNTRFVSRLNTCPFVGGKRTFFDRCHFESTDDAMAPTGVYLNCTFDFYSSKPFGHTETTGAVLLNCDIRSFSRGDQYFVKSRGPVAAVDTRMQTETATYWGWRAVPEKEAKYYYFNNSVNGRFIPIGMQFPATSVNMDGKKLLNAYRFEYDGKIFYNIYNLLRGNDEWDPANMRQTVLEAEKSLNENLSLVPTQLLVTPTRDSAETGRNTVVLSAVARRFGNYPAGVGVKWVCDNSFADFVTLNRLPDGRCEVISKNNTDSVRTILIKAETEDGLEGAAIVYLVPRVLDAPVFAKQPAVVYEKPGELCVQYSTGGNYADQSDVKWYRCRDAGGNEAVEVAVSRFNKPMKVYKLSEGDTGWYIMATVAPKNIRSKAGESVKTVFSKRISSQLVKSDCKVFVPDFSSQSYKYQPKNIPGCWMVDSYAPSDTYDWAGDNSREAWYYGRGEDGAANDTGLIQATKGARMLYMPVPKKYGDMKISFTAIPSKTAGQGFSSARQQYMDAYIKFDPETMTGYALRIIRTTKYGDALDFVIVRYDNGKVTPLSSPVSTDCYRPDCNISIEVKDRILTVTASNPKPYFIIPNRPEVVQTVKMETTIQPNYFGGVGFQHTGTTGGGATLIKNYKVEWR